MASLRYLSHRHRSSHWHRPPAWRGIAALALTVAGPAAHAQTQIFPGSGTKNSIAGKLLVALPSMPDPRFRHTVIFMAGHNRRGALGFIVNRVISRRRISDLLRFYKLSPRGARGSVNVHYGGPVALDQSTILHTPDYKRVRTVKLPAGLVATANPRVLYDIDQGRGPQQFLVIFGRAGWAPGQLERELILRTWVVIPFDRELVFGKDHAGKWRKALARREVDL